MNVYTFTNPINGQQFQIEGPDALTEAQARQIFQQQLDAGSLVGLKSGDLINSATQLAGGLKSAASQLSQSLAGVGGSTQGALTGAFDAATQSASSINLGSITGTLQSAAGKSLGAINSTINNLVPANPINIADLSKQATGLVPIQGLSQVDVRAAMSSVSTAVDQAGQVWIRCYSARTCWYAQARDSQYISIRRRGQSIASIEQSLGLDWRRRHNRCIKIVGIRAQSRKDTTTTYESGAEFVERSRYTN
jgi:hypothetical protein